MSDIRYYALVSPDNPNDADNGKDQDDNYSGTLFWDEHTAEEYRQHSKIPDQVTINPMTIHETVYWARRQVRDNPAIEHFQVYGGGLSSSLSLLDLEMEAAQSNL